MASLKKLSFVQLGPNNELNNAASNARKGTKLVSMVGSILTRVGRIALRNFAMAFEVELFRLYKRVFMRCSYDFD